MDNIIDGALTESHIVSHVDVAGLQPGKSKDVIIPASVLADGAGVNHADLINSHGFSSRTHIMGNDKNAMLGISVLKGGATSEPMQMMPTKGRQIIIKPNGVAEAFHEIAHSTSTGSGVHPLVFDNMSDADKNMAKKRASKLWKDHTHETVHENVFKSKVSDEKGKEDVKFLAEENSAVANFIDKNRKGPLTEFQKFNRPEFSSKTPHGTPAYVMTEDEFNKVYKTLTTSLKPTSPWEHGVTVRVTNIGTDTIDENTHALVTTKFHRLPIEAKDDRAHQFSFDEPVDKKSGAPLNPIHPKATSEPTVEPFNPSGN